MSEQTDIPGAADTDLTAKIQIDPKKAAERDTCMNVYLNQLQWERFDELKSQYGFSSSAAAARYFMNVGMLSAVDNDPRVANNDQDETKDESAPTVREYVPEGRESAVDLKDDLPEIIRDNILDIVDADDEIKRDGFEVWR